MSIFRFKHFDLFQENAVLKVGTDSLVLSALVPTKKAKRILDIGSGTGVIGLLMAQENPQALVDFVEVQRDYESDFNKTIEQPLFKNRCYLHSLCIQEFQTSDLYDLIVSNPPFYTNALLGEDSRLNTAKHVHELNLETLLKKVHTMLSEEGTFYFIWPSDNEEGLLKRIEEGGLFLSFLCRVYGKPNRIKRLVMGVQKRPTVYSESSFLIRTETNEYSEQYKKATREFHGIEL